MRPVDTASRLAQRVYHLTLGNLTLIAGTQGGSRRNAEVAAVALAASRKERRERELMPWLLPDATEVGAPARLAATGRAENPRSAVEV
jgi:hypothetical protein